MAHTKLASITVAILSILIAIFLMAIKPSDNSEEKLMLLAKDVELTISNPEEMLIPVELSSINVEKFKTVSILSTKGACDLLPGAAFWNITVNWRFLIQPGTYSSPIANTSGGSCGKNENQDVFSCSLSDVLGPHLAARIYATSRDSECLGGGCSCTVDEVYLYLHN